MVRGCVGCGMGRCACEAWFLEGFQSFLEHRWEKTDDLSRRDDSSMAMIHRESYSIRGELWVDKEDSL